MHKCPQNHSVVGSIGRTLTTNVSMTLCNWQIRHQTHVLCGCTTLVPNQIRPQINTVPTPTVAWTRALLLQRSSIGQAWTRHLAPAAPATRPSSPTYYKGGGGIGQRQAALGKPFFLETPPPLIPHDALIISRGLRIGDAPPPRSLLRRPSGGCFWFAKCCCSCFVIEAAAIRAGCNVCVRLEAAPAPHGFHRRLSTLSRRGGGGGTTTSLHLLPGSQH